MDWADIDAGNLLLLLTFCQTPAEATELAAAKLRAVDAAGALRGALATFATEPRLPVEAETRQ